MNDLNAINDANIKMKVIAIVRNVRFLLQKNTKNIILVFVDMSS